MAKNTTPKSNKPKNTGWGTVDHSRIDSNSMNLVHYSFKYTNSTLKGGIRIAKSDGISGNFVAGLTYINTNILPLEHLDKASAGSTSGLINYMEHLQEHDPANPDLLEIYHKTSTKLEVMTDHLGGVNCRFPQVLIPDTEGYTSLTPVCPASYPFILANKIKERELGSKITRVKIEQGGTQPLNVGRWASKYQTYAILCNAPVEDVNVRHAYSIFYKGINIAPSYKNVYEYYTWLVSVRENETISLSYSKDTEVNFLSKMVNDILMLGENAKNVLYDAFESLELSPNIKNYDILVGVIDDSMRTSSWKDVFSDFVANTICNYKLNINGQKQTVLIDYVSEQGLSSLIRSML